MPSLGFPSGRTGGDTEAQIEVFLACCNKLVHLISLGEVKQRLGRRLRGVLSPARPGR